MTFEGVNFDFSAATVLVTGGSNGIGLATARAFAAAGATVWITGRKPDANDYSHDFTGLTYRALDVTDRDAIAALAAELTRLDVLVHSAGGVQGDEWTATGFDQSLAVNLASVMHISNAFKPQLVASGFNGGASVIGVASMTSYFGLSMLPAYGAAKGGLVQLMKTLGNAWAADGIRANAVAAGLTRSNMTAVMIDDIPELAAPTIERQAIKRVGEPEDIAAAILFLASPAAAWITGQTLPVDGGFTITM